MYSSILAYSMRSQRVGHEQRLSLSIPSKEQSSFNFHGYSHCLQLTVEPKKKKWYCIDKSSICRKAQQNPRYSSDIFNWVPLNGWSPRRKKRGDSGQYLNFSGYLSDYLRLDVPLHHSQGPGRESFCGTDAGPCTSTRMHLCWFS